MVPDGSRVFFIRQRYGVKAISAYDFETKREWEPDFRPACGEGYARALALSPDGQQLAFMLRCDNEWLLQPPVDMRVKRLDYYRKRKQPGDGGLRGHRMDTTCSFLANAKMGYVSYGESLSRVVNLRTWD